MTDEEGARIWMWPISQDETRRLTVMLGRDFKDLNIGGTYVTDLTEQCSICGKDNEFIDWYDVRSPPLHASLTCPQGLYCT